MTDRTDRWKARVWAYLDEHRSRWLDLVREVIRRPSDNPPGDTSEVAGYIEGVLREHDLNVRIFAPLPRAVNLVSSLGPASGRHLILNGHLDTFPVEDARLWAHDPYAGEVMDGRIYGRGAGDMKGGTTALLAAYLTMRALEVPLAGRLTLTLVSDEETGGRWGTQWLLEQLPELTGDAVLSAEPSTTEAVNIAEKGICWIRVRARSRGGHGGLGMLQPDENAIMKMQRVLDAARSLVGRRGVLPEELVSLVEPSKTFLEAQPYGAGHSWVLDSLSLNVGRIAGGVKVNVVPVLCEAELDFRLPPGMTSEAVHGFLRAALQEAGLKDVETEVWMRTEPSHTPPGTDIVRLVQANAAVITGGEPRVQLTYGGTDCRFWRYRGVPAAVYGPRVCNMGAPDETITVEDFFTVLKVHAATIIDFLGVR